MLLTLNMEFIALLRQDFNTFSQKKKTLRKHAELLI